MPKEIDRLTDKVIQAAKPGFNPVTKEATTGPYRLMDGNGLSIVITEGRNPWWRFDYRFDGKQRTLSIGVYGKDDKGLTSLKRAREKRDEMRVLIRDGIDPGEARKEEKKDAPQQSERTWKDASDGYQALIGKKPRSDKTRDRDGRMIRYLDEAFGHRAINEDVAPDLERLLNKFEAAGSYETRMRLQAVALNIAGYAKGKPSFGLKVNPFLDFRLGTAYTAPKDQQRPAITTGGAKGEFLADDCGKLFRDIAAYQGRQLNIVGYALRLLPLTMVRPGTVCNAEWSEIDLDDEQWIIPFEKLKQRTFREGIPELKGKPHIVPLSRQAIALLRELHEITGNNRYLFPSRGGRPISTNALEIALNSMGYRDVHCPHGFRKTASTWLNMQRVTVKTEVGEEVEMARFHPDAVEFQLEHVDKDTAKIYNRDQRMKERTKMLQAWADAIDTMRDGPADTHKPFVPTKTDAPNIVQFRKLTSV